MLDAPLAAHDFIAGDVLTAADIPVGHLLFRWFTMDIPRKPRPALEAYYQRLTERPAYRDHVMVDYTTLQAEGRVMPQADYVIIGAGSAGCAMGLSAVRGRAVGHRAGIWRL